MTEKRKDLLFYIGFIAFPVLQCIIFYFVVNANSFILAFQKYGVNGTYEFAGFETLKTVFNDIFTQYEFSQAFKNSFTACCVSLFITFPLGVIFSYYIYKKFIFAELFKVVLFIPSIVSVVVMQTIFSKLCDSVYPDIVMAMTGTNPSGLMSNLDIKFFYIILFNVWIGFGSTMLYCVGAMSGVSPSVIEAGKIDGTNFLQEFWFIVLPLSWSTCKTLIIITLSGIFTTDLSIYLFDGLNAEFQIGTVGYSLLKRILTKQNSSYPYISALGLILTLITLAITVLVRFILNKFTWKDAEN